MTLNYTKSIKCLILLTLFAQFILIDGAYAADKAAVQKPNLSNAVTQAMVGKGALACASRINQVANFLGAGSTSAGAFLFVPTGDVDKQVVSTSMEITGADKKTSYSSATFAPNQANGCGALYEAVAWWPESCDKVAEKQFSKKATTKLKQNIGILDIGPTIRVFLMPTNDGCISIKKELVQ